MRSVRALVCVAVTAGLATACAPTGDPSPPPPPQARTIIDTVYVVDTVQVETEAAADAQLQEQVARLQIQLLERDVQLQGTQEQLAETRQEVVRNLAKLQSQASRAEAASGMAEAEIALQALARTSGGDDLPEYSEAQSLIVESSTEFSAENYGGALYLATQARTLVRGGQTRLSASGGESLRVGETLFAIPVPLQTARRANVRSGPTLEAEVQFTLEGAAPLTGQSYTSQWVHVVDDQGREGWIFHTLVTGRSR